MASGRARVLMIAALGLCASCQSQRAPAVSMRQAALRDQYLDLITTYSVYARSIWHEADAGGYWGDGIAARDQNGGVRGMTSTMLGYAMLVHAGDRGWLDEEVKKPLAEAGLERGRRQKY